MNDPKAIHPTDNFKIATYKNSLNSQMFEKSNKNTWRRLGNFMKRYFESSTEGFEKLEKGALQAVIIDSMDLQLRWKGKLLKISKGIVMDLL